MTGSYERKEFKGAAKPATLVSAINDTDLSFEISTYVGWPDGSTGPFVVCIDRNTSLEEKILCTSRTNGQVFVDTRGYDDTSAVAHGTSVGGVEHVIDASTLDQANRYVNLQSAKGDLVAHNGTNPTNVSVGTDNYVLTANSAASGGLSWSQVDGNKIASNAITADKIATGAVGTTEIATGAVAYNNLDSVVQLKFPQGMVGNLSASGAYTSDAMRDSVTVTATNRLMMIVVQADDVVQWEVKVGTGTLIRTDITNQYSVFGSGTVRMYSQLSNTTYELWNEGITNGFSASGVAYIVDLGPL